MVRVFDAQTTSSRSFPLGGADFVSFDPSGRLVVATGGAIYFEAAQGVLDVQYEGNVHGLAVSGGRVWFASGSELGMIEGTHVSITSGQHLSGSARLAAHRAATCG